MASDSTNTRYSRRAMSTNWRLVFGSSWARPARSRSSKSSGPYATSMASRAIFSGAVSATSSMSTPPIALTIMVGDLLARSRVMAR
jgi:hypothetical protein